MTTLQVSKAALTNFIQKLHLEPGDILLVKDPSLLPQLERCGQIVPFKVPLVLAPGGIQKLSRADILNLLEQLEESVDKSVLPEYSINAPL